jgi:hypothetical protein
VIPKISNRLFRTAQLTRTRIVIAFAVALVADGLQFLLNGVGWLGPDQVIDVMAMLLTCGLLGVHWLLLPTFALEFVPLADELPTWTACVAAVIVLRKREQRRPLPPEKPAIKP